MAGSVRSGGRIPALILARKAAIFSCRAHGQVHLGVVHVVELAGPRARLRESALEAGGFAPLEELRRDRDRFETWSPFLLDGWLE
jgi:predicted NUDIX family phosphoesterase